MLITTRRSGMIIIIEQEYYKNDTHSFDFTHLYYTTTEFEELNMIAFQLNSSTSTVTLQKNNK